MKRQLNCPFRNSGYGYPANLFGRGVAGVIKVECYSGFKANERPCAFTYQGERREIQEIVDRWYEGGLYSSRPVINYFKVKAVDGKVYLLSYQSELDTWSLCV